LVSLDKDKKHT